MRKLVLLNAFKTFVETVRKTHIVKLQVNELYSSLWICLRIGKQICFYALCSSMPNQISMASEWEGKSTEGDISNTGVKNEHLDMLIEKVNEVQRLPKNKEVWGFMIIDYRVMTTILRLWGSKATTFCTGREILQLKFLKIESFDSSFWTLHPNTAVLWMHGIHSIYMECVKSILPFIT